MVHNLSQDFHMQHPKEVFTFMSHHSLVAKRSKCSFGMVRINYLGHFISGKGVSTNLRKVEAVAEWSSPKSIKELRVS